MWCVIAWNSTLLWHACPTVPSLNSSMKSRACFSITLIASKMLLLKTPWGWGPTSRPAMKQSEATYAKVKLLSIYWGNVLGIFEILSIVHRAIWLDLRDSPTGCLATEREVEYFKRGCSFSRTRQLAGAMAFCNTKARAQLQIKTHVNTVIRYTSSANAILSKPNCELQGSARRYGKLNLHQLTSEQMCKCIQ